MLNDILLTLWCYMPHFQRLVVMTILHVNLIMKSYENKLIRNEILQIILLRICNLQKISQIENNSTEPSRN